MSAPRKNYPGRMIAALAGTIFCFFGAVNSATRQGGFWFLAWGGLGLLGISLVFLQLFLYFRSVEPG
jgi:hypothetical protein